MKRTATYSAMLIIALIVMAFPAMAVAASSTASPNASPIAEASAAPSAADATPKPTESPEMEAACEPTARPTHLPAEEPLTSLDDVSLNVDSLEIVMDFDKQQRVQVAELNVSGLSEGVSVDWYVSSYTGSAAEVELEMAEDGQSAHIYAQAREPGQSVYELICRCATESEYRELAAQLTVTVRDAAKSMPAKIEGIDLIYRIELGEKALIEPSNADRFPDGTQWSLTTRKAGLNIEHTGGGFEVSAQSEGRYAALITATVPGGESRMAYIIFDVGGQATIDESELSLNFDALNIALDVKGTTSEASYFIQLSDVLAYLPAEWTLQVTYECGAAQLRLETTATGATLYAAPVKAGVEQYELTCYIPSLERSVSIPVTICVRDSADGLTGIALKRAQYSLRLDEAITLSPYALPQGAEYPEGTVWTARQIGDGTGYLELSVDEKSGQTTALAFRPGIYTLEFSAQVSANRIYTTTVELIVSR